MWPCSRQPAKLQRGHVEEGEDDGDIGGAHAEDRTRRVEVAYHSPYGHIHECIDPCSSRQRKLVVTFLFRGQTYK